MSRIKIPIAQPFSKPKFVHMTCCGKCPSKSDRLDPESQDILTWSFFRRMRTTFACGWRPEGYCHAYYVSMYHGKPYNEINKDQKTSEEENQPNH